MRGLTKAQIKILKECSKFFDVDELPAETWQKLEEINDYETLYQDVNRFLMDQQMAIIYGR